MTITRHDWIRGNHRKNRSSLTRTRNRAHTLTLMNQHTSYSSPAAGAASDPATPSHPGTTVGIVEMLNDGNLVTPRR